jgi:hypothetical protein
MNKIDVCSGCSKQIVWLPRNTAASARMGERSEGRVERCGSCGAPKRHPLRCDYCKTSFLSEEEYRRAMPVVIYDVDAFAPLKPFVSRK